ncbi:MAG: ABC transporter permease [Nitrospirae bacterium]|jgi:peptide/nickel transport system permease protein|nr:ABC transporter permease [Nitrospirota bacterium]
MIRIVLIRLFHLVVVLSGILFLSFLLIHLAPGNFLSQMAMNPQVSPDIIRQMKTLYGLDKPFYLQFLDWMAAVLHGNLGYSFSYHLPVIQLLFSRIPLTLLLTVTAVLLSWGMAIPFAVVGASRPDGWLDRSLTAFSYLSISVPSFFLALLGVLLAGATGWFPIGGARSEASVSSGGFAGGFDLIHHLALPALTLALGSFGVLYRLMRSSVLEVRSKPFFAAARARGLSQWILRVRYLFRNALNPLVTVFGMELGGLLSGAAFVEMVYAWPGMGRLMLHAVMTEDLYLVMGGILAGSLMLLLGNLLADAALYLLDPRTREGVTG